MSVSLKRDTANVLFHIRLTADVTTGAFSGHPYYVSKLVALERLGCIEHAGPDRWKLTPFGRACAVSIPGNRAERLGEPAPATDDVVESDDVRDRRGAH